MKKIIRVPFDTVTGAQLHYPTIQYVFDYGLNRNIQVPPTYKDNFVFSGTLKISGYSRGQSAAYFLFTDTTTQTKYTMFLSDFMEIVNRLDNGTVTGDFTFCKRGQKFGVKAV